MTSLNEVARAIVAPGKGILAADESSGTIKKRFDSIDVESTEDRRRAYREMLFTTAGAEANISGVILFDETIRQPGSDGRPLVKVLEEAGIIPGIKVDKGTTPLALAPGELVTDGLDGLRARLVEYRELGAKFAKWRAVIDIGDGIPSQYCIDVNAHALARYAALCQDEGIVPIVEPEVLMDGDHSIERCAEVTTATLHTVFDALIAQRVELDGMLLKPNMVIPGQEDLRRPGCARSGRRGDGRVLPQRRARRGARHRVPVGRPERRGGDRQPRRDQQARPAPVADVVLVRPGAAARRAHDLAGRRRQRRRGPEGVPAPGPDERPRPRRQVDPRRGESELIGRAPARPHRGAACLGVRPRSGRTLRLADVALLTRV